MLGLATGLFDAMKLRTPELMVAEVSLFQVAELPQIGIGTIIRSRKLVRTIQKLLFFTNYNKNTDAANEKVENRRIIKIGLASGKIKWWHKNQ